MCDPKAGAFNINFRMKFQDGGSAVIRFPKPGCPMFPEEKIQNEVAAIKFIQDNTSIPVTFILHWGTREESPLGLGPFIIMEYINHETDVGSLEEIDESKWEVRRRPLSIHMNELVRLGTLARDKLPDATFSSSFDYFEALAELHIDHLMLQRNDAVDSETDCRRKYIARHLFRRLARQRKLTSDAHANGSFKLWCDDLLPSNILLDADMQIVGVVDWKFTYAAPAEFSFAPQGWLLLEQPEYWPDGVENWTNTYGSRLKTFLKAMTNAEDSAVASGLLEEGQRLSPKMKASWESGDFWAIYGARKSFAFDAIFWRELDSRFFGELGYPWKMLG
ncbi:hypothetical protein QQS21_002475 [Conoideocrella luteorostrata]|uniref:Aminoglycoside phosphotransferase domain-containing protein n=1 Tax=Conoideocrella luteorostrata TaxID=1105319 RepID=A0AAJ0CXZ3_9HYPO|nr:hypothetical protein QQS21_002475 [Conoideocrella luteorostrata]